MRVHSQQGYALRRVDHHLEMRHRTDFAALTESRIAQGYYHRI
jgi:hypothetical protein